MTGETISMSISMYLLLGSDLGAVVRHDLQARPEGVCLRNLLPYAGPVRDVRFPILLYFSLTTYRPSASATLRR